MKTLTIHWQRLVHGGDTCPRCGDTGDELRKATETLAAALAPLGIKVVVEEVEIDLPAFKRQPLESNRILLDGRTLEQWLDATTGQSPCCDVCGPNDCRTVTVGGRTYDAIPAELIIRAGLLAAERMTAATTGEPRCCTAATPQPEDKSCCS